jgi:hypothetical protein
MVSHEKRLKELEEIDGVVAARLHKDFDSSLIESIKSSFTNPNEREIVDEIMKESVLYRVTVQNESTVQTVREKTDGYVVTGRNETVLFLQPTRF